MIAKIYQLPQQLTGTAGVNPNFKYMVSGDDLVSITTAGYLNQIDLQSNPIAVTDILQILYDFNLQTQVGTYNAFSVEINNGIITLSPVISEGNVILPVVSGNLPKFSGTLGVIGDSGILATRVAQLQSLPVVSGDVAVFSSTSGQLSDPGVLFSALINRNVYNSFNVNAGLFFDTRAYNAPGGAVSTLSQCGVITTDSLTTASGASYTVTMTPNVTFTSNSVIVFQLRSNGTNTAGNNILFSYNVVAFGNPAVITILNANSGALNGTVVFSYFVVR